MQGHEVLIILFSNVVGIETHFVDVLVDFVLVFIVEAEVVEKIDKEFAWICLIPLSNAGKQHYYERVGLESSIFWLTQLVVVCEVLDDVEDRL